MVDYPNMPNGSTLATEPSRGTVQECRECQVICERVVAPWRCLRGRRSCLYAYGDGETTFVGCVHKVFLPELDMSAVGETGGGLGRSDPYGLLRVFGTPRPQCPVTVERAYGFKSRHGSCVNPTFLREAFSVATAVGGMDRTTERLDTDGSVL